MAPLYWAWGHRCAGIQARDGGQRRPVKKFSGIDVFDIEIDEKDPEQPGQVIPYALRADSRASTFEGTSGARECCRAHGCAAHEIHRVPR